MLRMPKMLNAKNDIMSVWLTKKHTSLVSMQKSPFMKKVYTGLKIYNRIFSKCGFKNGRFINA